MSTCGELTCSRSGSPWSRPPGDRRARRADGWRRGRSSATIAGQVVDAVQELDDDADVAQVVAPDLLDQLGVVPALDVDAAGPGYLGPADRRGDRAGCGPGGAAAGRCAGLLTGRTSITRLPSSRNVPLSGNTRRRPYRSSSVTASFSQLTTAPQKSPEPSSTTMPTLGSDPRQRRGPARDGGASTSWSYRLLRTRPPALAEGALARLGSVARLSMRDGRRTASAARRPGRCSRNSPRAVPQAR